MAYIGKVILKGEEARKAVLAGAKFLRECVSPTLGPFGTNGLLEKGFRITNDGVSIANEVELADEIENLGAQKLKESARKTNDQAGDGTTTNITLSYAILEALDEQIGSGTTVSTKQTASLIKQLKEEKDEIIKKLKASATPITTKEELIRSAVVSVEDEELGKLIGEAQWDLGPDGVILAEQTAETTTYIEPIKGIRIDNGLGLTQAINNLEKQRLELNEVPVVLTSNTLITLKPIVPVLKALSEQGITQVVLVCRAINDTVIKEIENNAKAGFFIYPINAPYVDQREIFLDLQAVLGGRFIDGEQETLDSLQHSDLGHASTIFAKRNDGIFAGKNDETTKERVAKRVKELEEKLAGSVSDFEKKNIQVRVAQLTNGFSLIKVGSTSETERKRVYDKVEDAVNAVRAAFQEGTVKGAGLAFKEIADELPNTYLLKKPIQSIYDQIKRTAPGDFAIEDWVRDPVKVLSVALEQAVSVAGDLATVSVAIHTRRIKAKVQSENE